MNTVLLAQGEITFEEEAPSFTGATMYVRLENITIADIAAEVVAATVVGDIAFDPKTNKALPFAIIGTVLDPQASYTVRVHIDLDGDGIVGQGDFISTQSYPVITFGYPREVLISVQQVK